MANSEYEYVKREFEFDRHLPASNWIVIRIDGCHFHRFVFREETKFYQRRESKVLSVCVSYFTSVYVMKWKDFCPSKELREPPYFDGRVVCYPNMKTIRDYLAWREHFLRTRTSCFHNSLISSMMTNWLCSEKDPAFIVIRLILSSCSSSFTYFYMMKLKEYFPNKELVQPPHFDAEVLCYPKPKIDCDYLSWRQAECHNRNQYNTCFWMLVKSGKGQNGSHSMLKGTSSKDKNKLLFQRFQMEDKNEPAVFLKGSCIYREKPQSCHRSRQCLRTLPAMLHSGTSYLPSEIIAEIDGSNQAGAGDQGASPATGPNDAGGREESQQGAREIRAGPRLRQRSRNFWLWLIGKNMCNSAMVRTTAAAYLAGLEEEVDIRFECWEGKSIQMWRSGLGGL